jgi:hypothetical protein
MILKSFDQSRDFLFVRYLIASESWITSIFKALSFVRLEAVETMAKNHLRYQKDIIAIKTSYPLS